MTTIQEQEHFTSALREVISAAHDEAVHMNATEVSPQYLFLGVLAQNDEHLAETFSALRLNQVMLRTQAVTAFPSQRNVGKGDGKGLPLSKEAYTFGLGDLICRVPVCFERPT